jgi:hypothetical protein
MHVPDRVQMKASNIAETAERKSRNGRAQDKHRALCLWRSAHLRRNYLDNTFSCVHLHGVIVSSG